MFKRKLRKVPIFKVSFVFLIELVCIPITFRLSKSKIGEPDEPWSVLHVWYISKLSLFLITPYETEAFLWLGYWGI